MNRYTLTLLVKEEQSKSQTSRYILSKLLEMDLDFASSSAEQTTASFDDLNDENHSNTINLKKNQS